MGLEIYVGKLIEDSPTGVSDLETPNVWSEEFDRLRESTLSTLGIAFEEPRLPTGTPEWHVRIGSWECIHCLRRIAAHIAESGILPSPAHEGEDEGEDYGEERTSAAEDPVLKRYYESAAIRARNDPQERAPLRFLHLIIHSDCAGYYLPLRFEEVIRASHPEWRFGEGIIGSSYRLREECEELAALFELPTDLHPEAVREATLEHPQGEGPTRWQRYGVESFTCSALLHAAHESLRTGCAIVFT